MSEAMTMSVEPPPPSPEQLADWQGLVERIRQGDRSEVVAWMRSRPLDQQAPTRSWSPSGFTGGCATHRPWWPARWLASSRSFG
jgi:hypothetical protein